MPLPLAPALRIGYAHVINTKSAVIIRRSFVLHGMYFPLQLMDPVQILHHGGFFFCGI